MVDTATETPAPPASDAPGGAPSAGAAAPPARRAPNVKRSAILGALVGFTVATTGVGVSLLLDGMDAVQAFGVGTFVGVWGGLGFGVMMGATIPLARDLD
jgi:ammonia channel protein AmtB